MCDPKSKAALSSVVSPSSATKALRNAGIVLLVTPDPFTGVAGAALLGASYATKRSEAADLGTLAAETARTVRTIRELHSLL